MGEHLLCKQGVAGSNPVISTRSEKREEIHSRRALLAAKLFDNWIRERGRESSQAQERSPRTASEERK